MKNNASRFLALSLVALGLGLASCNKEEASPLIVSRVTTYPKVTLTGDGFVSVVKGQSFADPGAVTKIGEQTVATKTSGTVDTATPGVYSITYTGTNSDGFSASVSRLVAVVDPAVVAEDLSGSYPRTSNGAPVTVTKIGTGLYTTSNLGGVLPPSAFIKPAYFAQISATELVFPTQDVPGLGSVSFANAATVVKNGKITGYKYVVVNPSFGTATRTFMRQ